MRRSLVSLALLALALPAAAVVPRGGGRAGRPAPAPNRGPGTGAQPARPTPPARPSPPPRPTAARPAPQPRPGPAPRPGGGGFLPGNPVANRPTTRPGPMPLPARPTGPGSGTLGGVAMPGGPPINRPNLGGRPNPLPGQLPGVTRPTPPTINRPGGSLAGRPAPTRPSTRPNLPGTGGVAVRPPTTRPGGFLPGVTNLGRPGGAVTLPGNVVVRPGRPEGIPRPPGGIINPPNRPGGNRPGGIINPPNRPIGPITRPGVLPPRPNRPGGDFINRPTINRPIVNRPTINRPVVNRPNIGNNINSGNTNVVVNRPIIDNSTTVYNRYNNRTVVQQNVVNRYVTRYPSVVAGGLHAPSIYPNVVTAGSWGGGPYYPTYSPWGGVSSGFVGGGWYGGYDTPYAAWSSDWHRGSFWSGFSEIAAGIAGGLAMGAAAASTSPQVIYVNPYQPTPALAAPPVAPATPAPAPPAELDYSRPIEVPTPARAATLDEEILQLGMKTFEQARGEFRKGDYLQAQDTVEKAIRLVPGDTTMHEVRALSQFAQKKYQDAAGTLYAVLSVAPGSTWDAVGALYPDQDTYAAQLRSLEDSIREGGNEPWRHFLLAYHYMVLDEREAALDEFRTAAKLNDKDQVSPRMVKLLENPQGKTSTGESTSDPTSGRVPAVKQP